MTHKVNPKIADGTALGARIRGRLTQVLVYSDDWLNRPARYNSRSPDKFCHYLLVLFRMEMVWKIVSVIVALVFMAKGVGVQDLSFYSPPSQLPFFVAIATALWLGANLTELHGSLRQTSSVNDWSYSLCVTFPWSGTRNAVYYSFPSPSLSIIMYRLQKTHLFSFRTPCACKIFSLRTLFVKKTVENITWPIFIVVCGNVLFSNDFKSSKM